MKDFTIELVQEPYNTMEENTIYVDGAIRGTIIDLENNSYSFDHHTEPRFSQSSAAFQVAMAVVQGLDLDPIEKIVVSSIDADSVLATAILRNPEWVNDLTFIHLIQDLSRIDNHGPASIILGEALPRFHYSFRPSRGEEETKELLMTKISLAEKMYENGTIYDLGELQKFPGFAIAFNKDFEIIAETCGEVSFDDVYKHSGFGILFGEKGKVTIGKKPFFPIKSLSTLWEFLTKFEPDGKKWGGADTIGGSPFGVGTILTRDDLLLKINKWLNI